MNHYLNNCDVSSGLLKNIQTLYQFNESIFFNQIDWGVENSGTSGGNYLL